MADQDNLPTSAAAVLVKRNKATGKTTNEDFDFQPISRAEFENQAPGSLAPLPGENNKTYRP